MEKPFKFKTDTGPATCSRPKPAVRLDDNMLPCVYVSGYSASESNRAFAPFTNTEQFFNCILCVCISNEARKCQMTKFLDEQSSYS